MNENEITPATAEATGSEIAPAPTSGLSTQSSSWAMKAEMLPNKDLHVPLYDLLFDGLTVKATILEPEAVDANDGKGEAAKIGFRFEQEVTSVEGVKKAPGFVWRSRFPYVLQPASDSAADQGQAERGRKDVFRLGIAAEVLTRKTEQTIGNIYRAVGQMTGKQVLLKMSIRNGNKRDPDTGAFQKFQNVSFASVNSAQQAAETAGTGDGDADGDARF